MGYRQEVRRVVKTRLVSDGSGTRHVYLAANGRLAISGYDANDHETLEAERAWATFSGGRARAQEVMALWRQCITDYSGATIRTLPASLHYPVRDARAVHTFRKIDRAVAAGHRLGLSYKGKLDRQTEWGYHQRHIRQTLEKAFAACQYKNALYMSNYKADYHDPLRYAKQREYIDGGAHVAWAFNKRQTISHHLAASSAHLQLSVTMEWYRRVHARGLAVSRLRHMNEPILVLDAEPTERRDGHDWTEVLVLWRPDPLVNWFALRRGQIEDGFVNFAGREGYRDSCVPEDIRRNARYSMYHDAEIPRDT